jgi:hypothetical protein
VDRWGSRRDGGSAKAQLDERDAAFGDDPTHEK